MHRQAQATRGGRGGRQNRRFPPAQRRGGQPQEEDPAQQRPSQQQTPDDGEVPSTSQHRQAPRQEKPVFKKVQKSLPDLAPKHVSTEFTAERNDPLMSEFAITDGVSGFLEVFQPRDFQVDYSGYMNLLEMSYNAQITADRSMAKYVSRSMWNYYHVIMLWRKLLVVRSRIGESIADRDALFALVGEDLPCSLEIAAYLNGLGDVVDQDGARAKLSVQGRLMEARYFGAQGSFGRVTAGTHYVYETIPSPLVALLRIRADIDYTDVLPRGDPNWNLPANLRPPANDYAGLPNVQLLGWRAAEVLTDTQRTILRGANITTDDLGVVNVGRIPVNELLIQSVAGYIRSSKVSCFKAPTTSPLGSLAQVPFTEKILQAEDFAEEVGEDEEAVAALAPSANLLLAGKLMRTSTCKQFSIHIASIASVFRYRIKRFVRSDEGLANRDMLCYQFAGIPPAAWIDNSNDVFHHGLGGVWNRRVFSMPEVSGVSVSSRYCEELRKSSTRK